MLLHTVFVYEPFIVQQSVDIYDTYNRSFGMVTDELGKEECMFIKG